MNFEPQDGERKIYYKKFNKNNNYILKVNFEKEKIDYGSKIQLGDLTTSNFENSENFVVLECVNRLLEKGYRPENILLEYKWPMGRKEKGKLDILIQTEKSKKTFLMIECKTWGEEYKKEKTKMLKDGGQLLSYYQQDKNSKYLCLYTSRLQDNDIEYLNDIIKIEESWKVLNNQKENFDHWNKNFLDNGIFDEWSNPYNIEIKALNRDRLKPLTEDDSGHIFNQFAEILRHNIVSDKPNAFNKIFNLFLCKIVDEDCEPNQRLKFQWLNNDTDEELQKRLSDLYKQGMKEYLTKEVTDYNDEQIEEKLYALDAQSRDEIRSMFTKVRLYKNNEFSFKEVFDEKSFKENAIVVREVVELLQQYQIRYTHKQQFLGDFFELLLSTGLKQEAGQFFTPVPIAKYIVSSMPIRKLIEKKISNNENNFLPYIIDYAAGSGHFLTEAMDEVQKIIEEIKETNQKPSVKAKLKSWKISSFDWAYDYIYGVEADYRLVKTAKVSCFLNGDGLANVIHADGLDNFKKSLDFKGKLKEVDDNDQKNNASFDLLIANPPYSVSSFKNTLKNGKESFELYERITDESSEIECLFIERAKQLLKIGGWCGIILPSSILSNTGVYEDTREIILKYFKIKSITEFGPNTFMATGTNTIALFLERRPDNDWKKINTGINNFIEKKKDLKILENQNAIKNYLSELYPSLALEDYISIFQKKPNDKVKNSQMFKNYNEWFAESNLIKKQFKNGKSTNFNDFLIKEIIELEKEKMLYFFLTKNQSTILIKTGEKQEEKKFLGYEFSNRRGHEGIKMYKEDNGSLSTKLYDSTNKLNKQKANYYVYKSFLNNNEDIHHNLKDNISNHKLTDLIDLNRTKTNKIISLNKKENISIQSKWPLKKLKKICNLKIGGTPSRSESKFYNNGTNLWVSISELKGDVITDTKEKITSLGVKNSNVKLIKRGTTLLSFKLSIGKIAIAGKDLYTNEAIAALELENEKEVTNNYLFNLFRSNFIDLSTGNKAFGKSLNREYLKEVEIPIPNIEIQKKITSDIKKLELNQKSLFLKKQSIINKIYKIIENITGETHKIKSVTSKVGSGATPKGGKFSYKSEGINLIREQNIYDDGFVKKGLVFINDQQAKKLENVKVEKNDLLLNITGASIGRCCIVPDELLPARVNQHVSILRPNNKIIPKLLHLILTNKKFKNLLLKGSNPTSRQALTKTQIEEFKIVVPKISLQNKLITDISFLEDEIKKIDAQILTIQDNMSNIVKNYLN